MARKTTLRLSVAAKGTAISKIHGRPVSTMLVRRVEMDFSQAELAKRIGVTFQQVQKYEKGVNRVGASRLQQVATALDVPVTFFFDDDGLGKRASDGKREVESLLFIDSAFSLRLDRK